MGGSLVLRRVLHCKESSGLGDDLNRLPSAFKKC